MKCTKNQIVLLTMWKIFLTIFLLPTTIPPSTTIAFAYARLHSSLLTSSSSGSGSSSLMRGGVPLVGKDAHVKTKDIDAVEGKSVSMPCPISAPLDDVYMVLWFRDNAGIPLYSFDVRDKLNTDQPRHWSAPEVFGSRARFHFDSQPATLEIKDIKRHDQGIYRCRVDFRTSQTQSFRFNLSVIILPEQPIILDRWGRQLNGTKLGPKQEGDDIVITCRVVGGRPQPQVRWLVNGLLVDNQYEHNSGDVIENRLLWPSVQRTDLHSVFTCQAMNTQLDKPKEKSFLLDMHLKPLTVKVINPPNSMVADRRYEVICESSGSRPNAIITWYKGKRQLRRTKDDISNNTTRSELSFVPTTDDDGKQITCRSENPNVNGLFLETMWKLNVVYPPLVTLRLGSTLTSDDIKEGDDVYFECHVQSNPQWRKLLWLHNGIHLEHNTSARVIRSNQSLVLQKITKHYAGSYACSAINDEGETVSNQLPLRVKYTPICKHVDRVILIGASKDETVEVACEIQADPPPRNFRWKFNNSGETLDVGSERFSINGSRSILKYTPVNDQDYGTLSCWAVNEVGSQNQPCLFQVVLAALPNSVINCTVYNRTELSVDIQCLPGYDGGLPQVFVLEMVSARTGYPRFNVSNSEEPQFSIENLDTLTSMMTQENNSLKVRIYSFNQKGRSPAYPLHDFIIGSTSYKTDADVSFTISPVIVGSVLTIVIISLVIALRIFVVTFLHNLRRKRQQVGKSTISGVVIQSADVFKSGNMEKPRWQHTDIKTKSPTEDLVEDERDPDVIPSQYAGIGSGGGTVGIGGTGGDGSGGSSGVIGVINGQGIHITAMAASKSSPNSKHNIATTVIGISNGPVVGNNPSTVSYNQHSTRTQILSKSSVLSPTGTNTLQHPLSDFGSTGLGSPTSSASTATIATAAQLQLQSATGSTAALMTAKVIGAGGGGSGTLPPGLGSGSGYILSSISNSSSAAAGLHHTGSTTSNNHALLQHGGSIGRTTALHHYHPHQQHHQQPLHHTLGSSSSRGTGPGGGNHQFSPLLTSQTTSVLTSAISGVRSLTIESSSTATTSCNSSSDLDDNININAIKDCLMTQRVPESCV